MASAFYLTDILGNTINQTNPLVVASGLMPVMPAPTVTQNATGTGAAIVYSIVPINASGQDGPPSTTTTIANNAATPNNTISWNLIPGADGGYRVLKGGNLLTTVGPGITSFQDNAGNAGTAYTATLGNALSPHAVPGSPSGQTQTAYGTATTPGAGAAIATLAAPGLGSYKIRVYAGYGGTADVAGNMQLKVGATVIGTIYTTPTINGLPAQNVFDRVNVPAGSAVTVNAIGAGAASSVYNALIMLTPIN